MASDRRHRNGLWLLLIALPALFVALILFPSLGDHGEGLLPEFLGQRGISDSVGYAEFAQDVRVGGLVMFGLACLAGLALWFALLAGWAGRLRAFRWDLAMHYQRFAVFRMCWAMLLGLVICAGVITMSTSLRGVEAIDWMFLAAACVTLAALQYYASVWGFVATRRLYRGR